MSNGIANLSKAERTIAAYQELKDIYELTTDDTRDAEQLLEYAKESVEAGKGLWDLKKYLDGKEYADASIAIFMALAGRVAQDRIVFDDGSTVTFDVHALTSSNPNDPNMVGRPPASEEGDDRETEDDLKDNG